jgi:hypothetical protein
VLLLQCSALPNQLWTQEQVYPGKSLGLPKFGEILKFCEDHSNLKKIHFILTLLSNFKKKLGYFFQILGFPHNI